MSIPLPYKGVRHMPRWNLLFLALLVILLAAPAAALEQDDIKIVKITPKTGDWIRVGCGEEAVYQITITNSPPDAVTGVTVRCIHDRAGEVPFEVREEYALSTYTAIYRTPVAGEQSGTATIFVRVAYTDDGGATTKELTNSAELHIDHGTPYVYGPIVYAREVTVNESTDITIRLEDRYGNPIDSRYEHEKYPSGVAWMNAAEKMTLLCSGSTTAGFWDGSAFSLKKITIPVDETGNVTTIFRVAEIAGDNIVGLDPPATIERIPPNLVIRGIPDAEPWRLSADFPAGVVLPADGESQFTIHYVLTDQWNNPAAGKTIHITTSRDDAVRDAITNQQGEVTILYGPSIAYGNVYLTAYAVENVTGTTITDVVRFASTEPEQMVLIANRTSVPSWDVPGHVPVRITAKVMDEKGNPIDDAFSERVNFSIAHTLDDYGAWGLPRFIDSTSDDNTTSAFTEGGYATVLLQPGSFPASSAPNERANCTVRAEWGPYSGEHACELTIEWTNVPWLSIETEVNPQTAAWTEFVEITITLKGDGYLMAPSPVDVILALDRSGSMDTDLGGISRLEAAKNAATDFMDRMDDSKDAIGLVSYSTNAGVDEDLTDVFSDVRDKIEDLDSEGWTATRKALKLAIEGLIDGMNPDTRAVHAVILLSDGEFNYYGDPLARGYGTSSYSYTSTRTDRHYWFNGLGGTTWLADANLVTDQNMSVYAQNNDIRIYTIYFNSEYAGTTWDTMGTLARTTGGDRYNATSPEELAEVYADIAGKLNDIAGANVTLNLDFNQMELQVSPEEITAISGSEAFEYVDPTTWRKYWFAGDQAGTEIESGVLHLGDDWETNLLSFDVDTIKLNQAWQAVIRLKVNATPANVGNINLFGDTSVIDFNDGNSQSLPPTFLTVLENATPGAMGVPFLDLSDLVEKSRDAESVTFSWNLTYAGGSAVLEMIEYIPRYGLPSVIRTLSVSNSTMEASGGIITQECRWITLPIPKDVYTIRVSAATDDAGSDFADMIVDLRPPVKNYIMLE
jgi:hypothetical protein